MRRISLVLILAVAVGSTGCSTMSNTEKGMGIGGALGAGVGTAIGAATGNPKTGAVVGGLVGAGIGGAAGSEADERDRERAYSKEMAQIQQATATADARKMGLIDVVQMNQQGIAPNLIINQIRSTGSTFSLSTADLNYLNEQHVPNEVIAAMQQAQPGPTVMRGGPRTVVVREPEMIFYERPYYRPRPVFIAPGPSFGVTYIHRR
jgi:hypothetical protein